MNTVFPSPVAANAVGDSGDDSATATLVVAKISNPESRRIAEKILTRATNCGNFEQQLQNKIVRRQI